MGNVESFIARRYLVSNRKVRFINVIGFISIVGITIGVAALLIALSVFNGFSGIVTSVLVGFDPHIRIEKKGALAAPEVTEIDSILRRIPRVRAFSPFISGKAMLVAQSYNQVVYLRGVDENRIGGVSGLKDKIVLGTLNLEDSAGVSGIVIGRTLADRLSSIVGDDLEVISPYGIQSTVSGLAAPQTMKLRITGIFESSNRDYDAGYSYISIEAAQRLFNLEGKYNGVEMRLTDFNAADQLKKVLASQLPGDLSISTWYDLHQSLYSVMLIERWSAYILLCLIIVVATFNMLCSLTMGVLEKRRDIAVLKAMGMTSNAIVRLFMVEGLLIGVIGTILGILLGLLILLIQVKYQFFRLDPTIYIIPAIPVEIRWMDFITIPLASLGLSYLAAYYPAKRAALTVPAQALRWE